jgi:hypothetical protein
MAALGYWIMANKRRLLKLAALLVLFFVTFAAGWVTATMGIGSAIDPSKLPERERQFAERMRGVAMVGSFTVDGRDRPPRSDRYDISSVEKVGDDRWRFNARIGETGMTLPVTVTMRWLDDTPMIMMTDMTIPAMGKFTARVFFYEDRYAGTWADERIGGHMFGKIERPQ